MLVLSVDQLMSVCHKPVLYQNCRMDRACFYHRGFPPQSTCPALSCMQIQLPLQIMVLLYVELCCNSRLRKVLQQPVDCCSLSSTLQPYLPTFNSSLSMVIIRDVKTVYFSKPVTGLPKPVFLPVTERPIVSGIIVTGRSAPGFLSVDRLVLHGGRGSHSRRMDAHRRRETGQWRI